MKKIRIVFESEDKKIGYIIQPDTMHCVSGSFNEECDEIVEISQEGTITNSKELCQQISWVLGAALKN